MLAVDQDDIWYIYSGCSKHFTFKRNWLAEFDPKKDADMVKLGDNGECLVTGEGTVIVGRLVDGVWIKARIERVVYVPGVRKNLFSDGMCTVRGYSIVFREDDALIIRRNEILPTEVKQSKGFCWLLCCVVRVGIKRCRERGESER